MSIYIEVDEGVVRAVYTDNKDLAHVHVVLVDYDDIRLGDEEPETPDAEQRIYIY